MTLKELIEINSIVFGVYNPKIRVFTSQPSIDFFGKTNFENKFVYSGTYTFVQITLLDDSVQQFKFNDYFCLNDVFDISLMPYVKSIKFKNIQIPYYTDKYTFGEILNSTITGKIDISDVNLSLLKDNKISSNPLILPTHENDSVFRGYFLEYDQTKIMKI